VYSALSLLQDGDVGIGVLPTVAALRQCENHRGRNILSARDQNTLPPLRKRRLMTLCSGESNTLAARRPDLLRYWRAEQTMPSIADHVLRILGEIRGRMTLAEVTEAP
jgi:hypothetical protein